MNAIIINAQRERPVPIRRMARVARGAIRQLGITTPGTMTVAFISTRRMRALNRRFCRHDRPTDVLSFRYDREPVVGEILIAPQQAQAYAGRHRIPYADELARYVVHGLLHWAGHEDRTQAQQRRMRRLEDTVLGRCDDRQRVTRHRAPVRNR